MSISLFGLTKEELELDTLMMEWALEHEGCIDDFPLNDEFERLEGERTTKLLNIGAWIKNLEAEATAHKEEQKRQGERVRVLTNKAESLKKLIAYNLAKGEKLHDTRVTLSFRRSERVIVDVLMEDLPEEFVITTVTSGPDKKAIKAQVKSEEGCKFAHMEENFNLQVK